METGIFEMRDVAFWFIALLDQKQAGCILNMKQLYRDKKMCRDEIFHGQLNDFKSILHDSLAYEKQIC